MGRRMRVCDLMEFEKAAPLLVLHRVGNGMKYRMKYGVKSFTPYGKRCRNQCKNRMEYGVIDAFWDYAESQEPWEPSFALKRTVTGNYID